MIVMSVLIKQTKVAIMIYRYLWWHFQSSEAVMYIKDAKAQNIGLPYSEWNGTYYRAAIKKKLDSQWCLELGAIVFRLSNCEILRTK